MFDSAAVITCLNFSWITDQIGNYFKGRQEKQGKLVKGALNAIRKSLSTVETLEQH